MHEEREDSEAGVLLEDVGYEAISRVTFALLPFLRYHNSIHEPKTL